MKNILNMLFVAVIAIGLFGGCSDDDERQPDLHLANTVWIYKSLPYYSDYYPNNLQGIYALCFSDYGDDGGTVMLYELDENLKKQKIGLAYGYKYFGKKVVIGEHVCEIQDYWIKYKNMTFFKSSKTELDIRTQ